MDGPARRLLGLHPVRPATAASRRAPEHDDRHGLRENPGGAGAFNVWTINGKAYPHEREFVLHEGQRYRLVFRNRTDDSHPVHLHRHRFELVDVNGKPTSGIMKDTVSYHSTAASPSTCLRTSPA